MPTNKTLEVIGGLTEILVSANVAVPIISATIMGIAALVKGLTGSGPSLAEIADTLELKLGRTDDKIKAEIARMQALLGQ